MLHKEDIDVWGAMVWDQRPESTGWYEERPATELSIADSGDFMKGERGIFRFHVYNGLSHGWR